ncbi:MAG: putative dsRNA-binding protein, partial [Candidatus Levybacteria bacterium]|nr:putative dsRNA-binding protein [Candidatus Levybacteria bacterium]
ALISKTRGVLPDVPSANMKNILLEECQKRGCPMPTFHVIQEGPPHMPAFRSTAEIVINGRKVVSDEVISARVKEGEQMASLNLLTQLGIDPLAQQKKEDKSIKVKNNNYVGALQTFAERSGWGLPTYEIGQENNGFFCDVRVPTDSDVLFLRMAGKSGKKAKRKAAEAMFSELTKES